MTQKERVNEIDLLRFIAAMAVVIFHYAFRGYAADSMTVMPYPWLAPLAKYGYLGAQLFFMISGFVILMTAANGSLLRFVVSRLVRLYPVFWVCCTISFALIVALGGARYSASFSQYLVNMTMLSGFVHVPSIDGVYWSLFVELQFYALVVAVLVMGKIHQAQAFLSAWLVVCAALELLPLGGLRHLSIFEYAPFFIAGATCFLIWSKGLSSARLGMVVGAWSLAVYGSIASLPEFERHYHTAMNGYVVGGLVSIFFLAMLMVALRLTGRFGRSPWPVAGALTYPLYLLHQNIGYMIFNIAYPAVNPHVLLWGTLVAVLGLSYAVNLIAERALELPMKRTLERWLANLGAFKRFGMKHATTPPSAHGDRSNGVPVKP